MRMLTHLSLFTGIGGLDIAAEMAGFVTVGQCEWADYPVKTLEKHWPHVPRWRDIKTLMGDDFYRKTGLKTIDLISGGFPCQPFSLAGKQRGTDDDRYLWPEMLRVISELKPAWVLGENVPGIINLALDTVCADLEDEGYEVQPFVIPACGVDAPHKRERVAIVANAVNRSRSVRRDWEFQNASSDGGAWDDNGRGEKESVTGGRRQDEPRVAGVADGIRAEIHRADAYTDSDGLQGRHHDSVLDTGEADGQAWVRWAPEKLFGSHPAWEDWPHEPPIPRVDDGVPNRVDRIRCLGNAVVPQQFYPFFAAMAAIETGIDKAEWNL